MSEFQADSYPFYGTAGPAGKRLTVTVFLQNDSGDKRQYMAHGDTVDEAVETAIDVAEAETCDRTWAMDEWRAS